MSGRFKRHISKASTSTGDGNGGGIASGAMARKKRRMENGSSEDEERSFWTPKHLGDLKAYNRSASEAPAELFRKDLISAMKIADNEPLTQEDYWGISDQWKQEWERGVQVPVNPDSLPEPHVSPHKEYPKCSGDFRLPRRFIRVTHSDFFNNEKHVLSNLPTKAEKMCRYDMDNLDDAWLKSYNGERARMGAEPVPHQIFELIIEHFEETCLENIHKLLKAEETLSIEFDEDVICDVCRSPDREEGNEMVFCDICNICVHQACYGITAIPSGSWLCRTCSLGIKPNCDLCPNKGGAMKSTKSGHKWAHVACALWIPEVSIGSVERMEPITKITNIPQSRWALVCVLCRERRGACIQCSVKSCKTAYHVTCAFKHGLEMKAIVEEENTDDVKLRSYCEKHSMTNKKDASDVESDNGSTNQKKKKDLTNEQKSQARAAKLRQIEAEFFNHVDVLQTSTILDIDFETTETIFYYWKLKRRAGFNKPLLSPRSQELDILSEQQEQDIERMKMFVQLRQYLERVRNLCYMVSRREKMSKSYLKSREQTFAKQALLLNDPNLKLNTQEIDAIAQANHSHTVYDKIYSHKGAVIHTQKQFENIVRIIACSAKSENVSEEEIEKPKKNLAKDINGLIKSKINDSVNFKSNPYRKTYFNGAEQRRSRSRSLSHCGSTETSSTEDSDSSLASTKWKPPAPGTRISVFTSSEDEKLFNKNSMTVIADHKSKLSRFTLQPPKFKAPYSSEEEDRSHLMKSLPPPSKANRGKRPIKRGRGRPRGGSKVLPSAKENSLFSSEEDKSNHSPSKFDALIKSSKSTPIKKEEFNKSFINSSDEEKAKRKSSKRSHRKSTPIKVEALSSSEEDLPVSSKSSPSKRGKGRGRGRGRGSSKLASLSSNPLSSWGLPSKTKGSDEDDLGPAIYKLTSEEEDKSDKSCPGTDLSLRRKELFGPSSDNKSDMSDNDSRTNKKELKGTCAPSKCFLRRSDTDALDSDDGKESGGESLNCSQMKTKAAMKEFTPKIAAKVEKFNNTKRGTRHSAGNEKIPKEMVVSEMSVKDSSRISDLEHSRDINLFVPQRAAAKKASELITSQNTGLINACLVGSNIVGPVSEVPTDGRKPICKSKELENGPSYILNEEPSNSLRKCSSLKKRRGRSSKDRLESKDDSDSEPPKKNIFDPPEILPYVPIREAARKAAENLKVAGKSGLTVVTAMPEDIVEPCITPTKEKKEVKMKLKSQLLRTTRNKSPRSTMKLLNDADSDSEEENESSAVVPPNNHKKSLRGTSEERIVDKGKSIFSESEDESLAIPKKIFVEKTCEPGKDLPHKQQLFRGDIFVCDHQSSSENEDDKGEKHQTSVRGRSSPIKVSKEMLGSEFLTKVSERRSKNNSFRTSRNITRLFGSDDQEEHENENEAPPAETRRKAPDKKLKTSDGRPEHGFQPPVTSRDESRTSSNKQINKIFSPKSTPIEKEEQRLCESRTKCRPRIVTSNNTHRDLRSNTDAPLSIAVSQEDKVTNACKREGELDKGKQPESEDISFKGCFGTPSNNTRRDEQVSGKILSEEPSMLLQPKTSKTGPEKGFKSTFECISDPIKEEAPLIRTVVCEESPKSISGPNIFNFTENEVEIKRLEDIVESSDNEQEPKKVKITDSDDDSFSLVDRKVEQTKDSGYKSAIVTPEPVDRVPQIFNNLNQISILNSDQFTADLSGNLKKTRLQELQSKSLSKFSTPGRRKNLEDVIEERKKAAEQTEVALAGLDKRNELPRPILSPPPPFQMPEPEITYSESNEQHSQVPACSLPVSESTSAGSSVSSTSSAPSSFVEEWREQWGAKNSQTQPVQMDHMEAPPPYPPMPHHPGLPTSLNEFQYYMDMQANHYPNNLSVYINQLRMMQLALFSQQYAMPPKTHDNQLEEEANMLSDISARHARDDHTHRISAREHHSRLPYEEPKISLPSKLEELQIPSSNSSSHSDIRNTNELKNVSTLPPSLPVQAERTITPITTCDSPLPGTPSSKSILPNDTMKPVIKSAPPPSIIISSIPSLVDKHKSDVNLGVCTVLSKIITTTATVTTASSKISTQPCVSPARSSLTDSAKHASMTPITSNSWDAISSKTNKPLHSPSTSLVSTKTSTHTSVTSVISSTSRITSSTSSLTVSSPISSIVTPSPTASTAKVICSPTTVRSPEISTVDTSVLHSPSPQKRIPIYMQEAKTPKIPEKRSPRTATASSSPRWSKQDKKEKKQPVKSNRGKAGRGRGAMKRKRKSNSKFNLASVPKELVGTVYDFDFDDEFDDDRPANNTLDDLRQLREKRQSIDAVPSLVPLAVPQNTTPTYSTELIKDQPPKKRVKEKKQKSVHKDRTPKHEEVDEVAKILEDYRNQQNSTLKKSVHEPSPPQIGLYLEPKKLSPKLEISESRSLEDGKFLIRHSPSVDERKKIENFKNGLEVSPTTFSATTVVTSSLADDRTNQLKLKIKGPYANSYPSNFTAPTQEMSSNPNPQSTTTTLRRMRKKELIRQYCYQDMNPDQGESNAASNSSNPPQQLRTGITLPKAVASMTSIPTREDYKMYTQDDSSMRSGNSSRRRRQPRELKQLDWTLLEEKGKRNTDIGTDGGRKRARGGKESSKRPQSDEKEDRPMVPLSNKLRISLGKKGSEISQVTGFPSIMESSEMCSKGKPPKKRHPEESTIMKVMSANLKFREEIMANFERSGSSKVGVGEKKSKKRKFGHLSESGNSPSNSDIRDEEMKVVKNDDSRKLVLKFSKKTDNGLCGTTDERVSSDNKITHPLKIRLSLANRPKEGHSSDPKDGGCENGPSRPSSREGRLMSIKIKLQRRPEGYVTSKSTEECPKDEGPGPPPEPPDPPSLPLNKLTASSSFHHTSNIRSLSPKDVSLCKTIPIEHKDRESLSLRDGEVNSAPTTQTSLRPLPHSRISEDVLQQLEAQLAATDGGIPLPSLPSSVNTHNFPQSAPPSSFSALQAVPTLKDEFGCR